ncbi:hypothetical protein HMPREF1544_01643 [Mucor circinelloides 1006PhL]|uniref:Uncharacterized protein n=1 Tax=Mucor circinelloides f. circinelloides (strain 1006PhL) TaxID=1220926 RepID=S2JSR5_MUCC1|nr:hypothetical protein HMPREF1544_01643 [Mucor circinelloides 1006PhL]KAG1108832.1 hypothetical protein G6F42_015847 [Rhizopus arrhizus]
MKSFYFTALVFLLVAVYFTSSASAYLGERSSPFTIEATDKQDVPITLQHGDTLHIQWTLAPGVRFPLYGYASAKTAKTEVGLLPVDSTRTQDYTHIIDTEISIRDHAYTWTVTQDVPKGKYRLGLGFFYHETTQNEIHII